MGANENTTTTTTTEVPTTTTTTTEVPTTTTTTTEAPAEKQGEVKIEHRQSAPVLGEEGQTEGERLDDARNDALRNHDAEHANDDQV